MRVCNLLMIQLLSWASGIISVPRLSKDTEKLRGKRLHSDLSSNIPASDGLALSLTSELEFSKKLARHDLLAVGYPEPSVGKLREVEASQTGSIKDTTMLGLSASPVEFAMSSGRTQDHRSIQSQDFNHFPFSRRKYCKDCSINCQFHGDHRLQAPTHRKMNQLLSFYSFFGMELSNSKAREILDLNHRPAVKEKLGFDLADEMGSFLDEVAKDASLQPSRFDSSQEPIQMNESRPLPNPETVHKLNADDYSAGQFHEHRDLQPLQTMASAISVESNSVVGPNQLKGKSSQPHEQSLLFLNQAQHHSSLEAEQSQFSSRDIDGVLKSQPDLDAQTSPSSNPDLMAPPQLKLSLNLDENSKIMPGEQLDRYLSVFGANIKILSERFGKFLDASKTRFQGKAKANNQIFEGISAVHVSFPTNPELPSCIRLKNRHALSSRLYAKPTEIMGQLRCLLKWMLFNHNALHCKLGKSKSHARAAQDALVNWLLQEFFFPDHQRSLPVLGEGRFEISDYTRGAFGSVQILLIDHILSGGEVHATNHKAREIIRIWYQKCGPDHWKSYFENVTIFGNFITQAAELSSDFRPAFRRRPGALSCSPNHIEDFQIIPLENFKIVRPSLTSRLQQKWFHCNQEAQKASIEKTIIEDAVNLYEHCVKGKFAKGYKFRNLSICLVDHEKSKGNIKLCALRLLRMDNHKITPAALRRFLKTWFERLRSCHTFFLAVSEYEGISAENNAQFKLLTWLQKELFDPDNGLAIFGTVPENFKNLNEDAFTEFQRYVIISLTKFHVAFEFDQVFSAIIGFWYKKTLPEFWNANFKEDKDYWHFMAHVIRMKNYKS